MPLIISSHDAMILVAHKFVQELPLMDQGTLEERADLVDTVLELGLYEIRTREGDPTQTRVLVRSTHGDLTDLPPGFRLPEELFQYLLQHDMIRQVPARPE